MAISLPAWKIALNTALMILVAVPAVVFTTITFDKCALQDNVSIDSWQQIKETPVADLACHVVIQRPLLAVNLIFFVNVDILFWLLSFVHGSTWLIDPYWTLAPPLISLFYCLHPLAKFDGMRSTVSLALMVTWSARLTYSYFRRERWQVGAREDWRFTHLAQQVPGHWWWMKFFATYLVQQPMLVGITLPIYAIHSSEQPWDDAWEAPIMMLCLLGIMLAHFADTDLHHFTRSNEKLQHEGKPPVLVLTRGLWRYSRHPNYFGEQLFWWSLSLWATLLGQPWMVVGTAFNSLCMVKLTLMTEQRMLARSERAADYRKYQSTTSVWVPWFKMTKRGKMIKTPKRPKAS